MITFSEYFAEQSRKLEGNLSYTEREKWAKLHTLGKCRYIFRYGVGLIGSYNGTFIALSRGLHDYHDRRQFDSHFELQLAIGIAYGLILGVAFTCCSWWSNERKFQNPGQRFRL